MKISQKMYDEELQSFFGMGRAMSSMMSKNWGVRLFNFGVAALKGRKLKMADNEEHYILSRSTADHQIRVRLFRPAGVKDRIPAMLYLHGGGYMMGAPEQAFPFYEGILRKRNVAIVAPAYRLSVKDPFPAGFNDCYDTLLWMKENAHELGIQSDNYIIGGHSAGGGLTAALTLKARNTKDVDIAFQMPIYPMIDHRMSSESSRMEGAPVWDARNNRFGWSHYLKGLGEKEVPVYAAPALNQDYTDFPPTISFVGDMEPFRDETIAYMQALEAAGVPTLFKVFKGAFHGFDAFTAKTRLGHEANQFQWNGFAEFFDRYVKVNVG